MPEKNDHILLVSLNFKPETSGIGPYASEFVRWLTSKDDRHVSVLAAYPHYPQWRRWEGFSGWVSIETSDRVVVRRLLHYVPRRPTSFKRILSEISFAVRVLFSPWPDASNVVATSPALFAALAALLRARVTRRRFVVWCQDVYTTGLTPSSASIRAFSLQRAMQFLEGFVLREATSVVVIHPRFQEVLVRDFGVDEASVEIVRNWTKESSYTPTDDERAEARAFFDWRDDFVIVHTGAQGAKQDLVSFVRHLQELQHNMKEVRWVFVGDGSQRAELEKATTDMPSVELMQPVGEEQFSKLLAAADAFLLCERDGVNESAVPSKLTTYFAAGKPIIGFVDPKSISADEVRAAGAGSIVGASALDIYSAVLTLRDDAGLCQKLGASGREYMESNLTLDQSMCRFAAIL